MLFHIYKLPILALTITAICISIIWAYLNLRYGKDFGFGTDKEASLWTILNFVLFVSSILIILYITVFSRSGSINKVVLTPFYSFAVAKIQPEMWRQLFMNVILFMPLGLSLSCSLGNRLSIFKRFMIIVPFGASLSIVIELVQHFYSLGEAWTDDVLCNVLGAFIGALVIVIPKLFQNKKNR